MSALDRGAVHTHLLDRLQVVLRRSGAIGRHLRQEDGRLDADFEDRVAFVQSDEVLEALDADGRAEVVAIRAALDRLDSGTYGACAGCGAEIPAARLAVVPETSLCVACATRSGG